MVDDCALDYEGEGAETGKEIGRDFAEGKKEKQITLPVILALSRIPLQTPRRANNLCHHLSAARTRKLRQLTRRNQIVPREGDAGAFSEALRLTRETHHPARPTATPYPPSAARAASESDAWRRKPCKKFPTKACQTTPPRSDAKADRLRKHRACRIEKVPVKAAGEIRVAARASARAETIPYPPPMTDAPRPAREPRARSRER